MPAAQARRLHNFRTPTPSYHGDPTHCLFRNEFLRDNDWILWIDTETSEVEALILNLSDVQMDVISLQMTISNPVALEVILTFNT